MVRAAVGWCAVLAMLIAPTFAHGQQQQPTPATPGRYHLAGTVADIDGNAIPGAEVAVMHDETPLSLVHSDSLGHFRIDDLPATPAPLRVRRIGYGVYRKDVRAASEDEPSSVIVTLEPVADTLEDFSDVDELRTTGFFERMNTNHFGHYVTPKMLARMRPQYASDALRGMPGVTVRPSQRIGNEVRIRGCTPLVWVDGTRALGAELDDVADGRGTAAIEVYNSFAAVPAQYFDRSAACGTILVWTRTR